MENIDPQLRSANPVNAFLEESRRRFEARLQQPSVTTENSDNADADAAMPNSMGSAIILPVGLRAPAELTATIRRIKRKADFSDGAEVDFDNFCAVRHLFIISHVHIYITVHRLQRKSVSSF